MDRPLFLNSPEATRALGARIIQVLPPPAVVALCGPLGAGKTELVRGMARALGIRDIRSPSFVILMRHSGFRDRPVRLYHLDLYRLDQPEELPLLGLEEALSDPGGYVAVEWAEKAPDLLARADLRITFLEVLPGGRTVRLEGPASVLQNLMDAGEHAWRMRFET